MSKVNGFNSELAEHEAKSQSKIQAKVFNQQIRESMKGSFKKKKSHTRKKHEEKAEKQDPKVHNKATRSREAGELIYTGRTIRHRCGTLGRGR